MTTLIGSDSFGLTSVWPKTGDMAVNATVRAHSGEIDHPFRRQTDHLFRCKPITRSDANRSPVGAKRRGTKS